MKQRNTVFQHERWQGQGDERNALALHDDVVMLFIFQQGQYLTEK